MSDVPESPSVFIRSAHVRNKALEPHHLLVGPSVAENPREVCEMGPGPIFKFQVKSSNTKIKKSSLFALLLHLIIFFGFALIFILCISGNDSPQIPIIETPHKHQPFPF